jgi:hypothetical protein
VLVNPFTGPDAHLFPALERWMLQQKDSLRQEIRDKVGI